jgi:GntR family transcriptional repressor for pyruvate dehydrogenase complex
MTSLMTPITLAERVRSAVEEEILDGRLEPGSQLPSESKLAERFGVSRVVVREATRGLEARRLVEIRQGKRPVVSAPNAGLLEEFFALALRRDEGALLELLELRRAVDVHAARLAAQRSTEAGDALEKMEQALATMRETAHSNHAALMDADVVFHEALAEAGGNQLMRFLVEAFNAPLQASRRKSMRGRVRRGESVDGVIDAHARILAAVRAGDADRAAAAMDAHLEETQTDLQAGAG